MMLMSNSIKSLQLRLNELVPKLKAGQSSISNAAYSKARHKLQHTAFIELNKLTIVDTVYGDHDYKTYKGLRILATDGSKIQLPTNDETREVFGVEQYKNQRGIQGEHSYALASVLYDVLSEIVIDARLEPIKTYEVDLAGTHLQRVQKNDLIIYDRGYCAFQMMALVAQTKADFLIRCHDNSFSIVNEMLRGKGSDDVIVTITANSKFLGQEKNRHLPIKLPMRFVRVILDTGEYEVLATSLLDQEEYTLEDFKHLYWLRWGIETLYGRLKTRLNLENFSGLSSEAIRQDFHATILLTGLESILTEDADELLRQKQTLHPQKTNKAVTFNAIKYRAFELFLDETPTDRVITELTDLFLQSPTIIREDRNPPRVNSSARQILNFFKRARKIVF
jgi:ASC-1-like (ASCH) protein